MQYNPEDGHRIKGGQTSAVNWIHSILKKQRVLAEDWQLSDLRMHYDNIRQMVKEKTGRAMQEKERERKGKNGKIVKIAGCSPIREGVLLVRSDTTLADVRSRKRKTGKASKSGTDGSSRTIMPISFSTG